MFIYWIEWSTPRNEINRWHLNLQIKPNIAEKIDLNKPHHSLDSWEFKHHGRIIKKQFQKIAKNKKSIELKVVKSAKNNIIIQL
jgi:hypothetical protein